MSGIIGMNDWEKELAAGRRHIKKVAASNGRIARLLNEGMKDELQPGAAPSQNPQPKQPEKV